METFSSLTESIQFEYEWLGNESWCEWAKHHSSFQIFGTEINVGVNAILPIINEEVHRSDTMFHVMNLNKKITNFLNPSQVYVLTKTIQQMYPETQGSGKYLSIIGSLHIEQSALVMHRKIIKGSGLQNILSSNNLSIIGTSAVVDVNDTKRTHYCLQVAACPVFRKLKDACIQSNSLLPILDWLEHRSKCFYWKLIRYFQVLVPRAISWQYALLHVFYCQILF